MNDVLTPKQALRQQMREKRHEVGPEDRREAGLAISEKVVGAPINLLTCSWRVCLYLSTRNEIPTRYVARAFWELGREVCVPAWSTSEKGYRLYGLDPRMRLITGHHGIREPEVRVPVMPWDVNAFVLPGLVFDVFGGRLGYGAGYYDQILAKASRNALKIAVCYDWQVLDTPVPQEPHDIPMDWIVTEKRAIRCADSKKEAPRL
jgi:5-formyltetrahydrofolate cyclo-ligase